MMRRFIIAAASAATLFSLAAFAQEPSQGTTSIPDFSGVWSYPYWPSFELPLSGPGPVVNKLRRRQVLDADGRPLPAANAPLAGDPLRLVGDYTNPILKPEAAEIVKKQGELELIEGAPTPTNQCWPGPVPYIFRDIGMQMFQRPDRITILYFGDQVRHVRMNQPHPATVTPSWYVIPSAIMSATRWLSIPWESRLTGGSPWSMRSGRPTPRLCTWWNVIGSSTMKSPKKRKSAMEKKIGGSAQPLPKDGYLTRPTRAKDCSSSSRSRMQ